MNNSIAFLGDKNLVKQVVFNLTALVLIYFMPAISHMVALPIYYLDPMRLVIILSLVHTNKGNSYILALTLPLFSFFISAHPVFVKAGLIMAELSLNIFLFYYLSKKTNNVWLPALSSIFISKVIYYLAKYFMIQTTFIGGELISTPLLVQAIVGLLFTGYLFFSKRKNNHEQM